MLVAWPPPGSHVSTAHALHLHGSRYIGLRTRFYDDAVLAAARDGIGQAVLLGAGLDTRAFRLELPGEFRLFEVDQAGVLAYKRRVLEEHAAEPRCDRHAVAADLRDDWIAALEEHPFVGGEPTAWIAEGLLAYLPPGDQARLLRRIGERSAPGSRLAFDRIVGDVAADGRLEALAQRSGIAMDQLLAAGPAEDLRALLQEDGWHVEERTTDALASHHGRDLTNPFDGGSSSEPPWLDTVFVTARRDASR